MVCSCSQCEDLYTTLNKVCSKIVKLNAFYLVVARYATFVIFSYSTYDVYTYIKNSTIAGVQTHTLWFSLYYVSMNIHYDHMTITLNYARGLAAHDSINLFICFYFLSLATKRCGHVACQSSEVHLASCHAAKAWASYVNLHLTACSLLSVRTLTCCSLLTDMFRDVTCSRVLEILNDAFIILGV